MIASHAGGLHPIGDSFAAFRIHLWTCLGVVAVVGPLVFGRLVGVLGLVVGLGSFAATWQPREALPDGSTITVFQHNVLIQNRNIDAVIAQIEQFDADFVALQEVSETLLAALEPRYPHRVSCTQGVIYRVVLSRYAKLAGGCIGTLAWGQFQTEAGPITIASQHLNWPWPFDQQEQVMESLSELQALPRPVIVAGDFNAASWSHAAVQVAQSTDTRPVPQFRMTYRGAVPGGLPIDLILVPEGSWARQVLLGRAGADHSALLSTVVLP